MSLEFFRKWANRWLGIVAGMVAIGAALFGGIRYIVSSEVSALRDDVKRLEALPDKIASLGERVARLEGQLNIKTAAAAPTSKEAADDAKKTLENAKSANLKFDVNVIRDAGDQFLSAGQKDPIAWDAALAFVEYRSWLNLSVSPVSGKAQGKNTNYRYQLNLIPNPDVHAQTTPVVAARVTEIFGPVAAEDSARIESLDKPQVEGSGVRYLVVQGITDIIVLDGEYLKNAVIRDSVVEYRGGAVRLQNVYFINCTFRFHQSRRSASLGRTMLASASVTFESSPA